MRKAIYIIILMLMVSGFSVVHAAYSPLNRRVWEKNDAKKGGGGYLYNPDYTTIQYARFSGNRYSPDVYSVGSPIYMVSISRVTSSPTLLLSDNSGAQKGGYGFGEVPHDNTPAPLDDEVTVLLLMALALVLKKRAARL